MIKIYFFYFFLFTKIIKNSRLWSINQVISGKATLKLTFPLLLNCMHYMQLRKMGMLSKIVNVVLFPICILHVLLKMLFYCEKTNISYVLHSCN